MHAGAAVLIRIQPFEVTVGGAEEMLSTAFFKILTSTCSISAASTDTSLIRSGFHSETEEDHQLSLSLMEACAYDSAFMFKYSERPGTYASKHLPDDVPEEVKIRRLNEIIALQNRLSAEANARCIGKEYEVLVEGVSKRSKEQLFGRTEQNRVVVFDRGTHRIGQLVHVRITSSSSATLLGEALD